jgi:hypothetical protein
MLTNYFSVTDVCNVCKCCLYVFYTPCWPEALASEYSRKHQQETSSYYLTDILQLKQNLIKTSFFTNAMLTL